ncbi:2,3-bisphosphoglycerate-independent phosphoglycerate mutase [Acidaminobacter hydrogenoformans]|uniref:2,3-bisphosphoglycerate-independent phosphoglycerate mutase n=1 Tax=Acidaminobacter hydrogenoformans DSM 2784 TaxID=1120920 RepID=A0A1G5S469_9FIRM|nr:2,3-bisphosphoglycerate-independent phosphoglycerate mutase [Acidaminobacter hydrogenoformans]SCZ80968.1 phosphoglycerate mutase [Acidaminobacter hydrogenoformans DSM 2784]
METNKAPVMLIVLDGWGYNQNLEGNAIEAAKTPVFNRLMKTRPHVLVGASGMDVGLPEGQMGNSEVGHLNIGAGRVVYQELTRITKSILDGDFYENPALTTAVDTAIKNGKNLHLLGLVSDGGVHSHMEHLKALVDLAAGRGLENVFIHAFLDGRDTSPTSGLRFVEELEGHLAPAGAAVKGKIATVSGRYYAMDRDKRWERVERAYNALVHGEGHKADGAVQAIRDSYAKEVLDEFVEPVVIQEAGAPVAKIQEGDSVIFFNFRPDRAREMTRALTDPAFDGFNHQYFPLHYVCMTQYDITMPNVAVAYAPQVISNTLGEYLGALGKRQLRIAETEKYAHVTFFFNGGVEAPNPGEDRKLIPSPKVATYDLKPEMSALEVTEGVLEALDSHQYDLIVLNFANPDMVGHTGVFDAAVKAVETVDQCLGRIVEKLEALKGSAIITADHGNAEMMVDYETHESFTAHTTNPVPCLLLCQKEGVKLKSGGRLCDLAPTLLELMGLEKPAEMTGVSLIEN